LNIAESSLAEVWQCLHSATRLGYLSKAEFATLESELNGVGAPLAGLIRSTRRLPLEITAMFVAGAIVGGIIVSLL